MAESESASEVLPYHFEPVSVSNYSNNEDSTSESETDIREQASFTERLGSTSWCKCIKCSTMSSGIECQCCRETESVIEHIAKNESYCCITNHEQFKIVCLNKHVLYKVSAGNSGQRLTPDTQHILAKNKPFGLKL